MEITQLSEELGCLRLSTPELERDMRQSLERHGQLTPILAYRTGGGVQVVDGFKRLRSARALSWGRLRVQAFDEQEGVNAKVLLWRSNQGHELTDLEEAWVVRALYREDRLTQPRIAQLLGRHKSWVSRRLMLAEGLCDDVQAQVRLGLLSATSAREIGRLPRGNQSEAAEIVTRRGLTTRQSARLVNEAMAVADEGYRRRVLDAFARGPLPEGTPKERTARRTPGEWLAHDVAATARTCTRLCVRLLERPLSSYGESAAEVVTEGLSALVPSLVGLQKTIERQLKKTEVS